MLNPHPYPWPLKQYFNMYKGDKLNFDILIQRKGKLWNIEDKSSLIESILSGMKIFQITGYKRGTINYVIDGRQRLEGSIFPYLDDQYALVGVSDIDGYKIDGKKFSELDPSLQKKLRDYSLTYVQYDETITPDEIIKVFTKLNNGKALTPTEKFRVLLGEKNLLVLGELASHPFIVNKTSISGLRFDDQNAVLQIMLLLEKQDTGLASKQINEFVNKYAGVDFTEFLKSNIKIGLEYLDSSIPSKKKYMGKLSFPMSFIVAQKAIQLKVDPNEFGIWIDEFFKSATKGTKYFESSQNSSAKKANVVNRLSAITDDFQKRFVSYDSQQFTA